MATVCVSVCEQVKSQCREGLFFPLEKKKQSYKY